MPDFTGPTEHSYPKHVRVCVRECVCVYICICARACTYMYKYICMCLSATSALLLTAALQPE